VENSTNTTPKKRTKTGQIGHLKKRKLEQVATLKKRGSKIYKP
jgi:hypothetical protein